MPHRKGRQGEADAQAFDDAIDVGEADLLLTQKVEVDGALTDAGVRRQLVDRHLLVAEAGQAAIGGIQDRFADCFSRDGASHESPGPPLRGSV